jgi:hypothetical protein
LIAALAGLWMIPPGLYILFWPLRSWRKLRRTCYALTDRRAVIIARAHSQNRFMRQQA